MIKQAFQRLIKPYLSVIKPTHYRHRLEHSGRVYLYKRESNKPYNRWVGSVNNSYGEHVNWSSKMGTTSQDSPYYSNYQRGYIVKAGTRLRDITIHGKFGSNATNQVTDVQFALLEVVPKTDYDMAKKGYYATSHVSSNIILRDNWFKPISDNQASFDIVDNWFRRRTFNIDYIFNEDCILILCFKPDESSSLTKTCYFYADVVFDFDSPL